MTHKAKASLGTKARTRPPSNPTGVEALPGKMGQVQGLHTDADNFLPQLMANDLLNCFCRDLQNDHQNIGLIVDSTEQEIIIKIKEMTNPKSPKNRKNKTKNPADVVYTTELLNDIKAMGLANFAMEVTTTVNGKTRNLQLELTKAENRVRNK